MSDRYIEVGEKKWKNPTEEAARGAVRWKISTKGNPYTTFRGYFIVVTQNRWSGSFAYALLRESVDPNTPSESNKKNSWEWHGKFATQDEAKDAALLHLAPKREPVAPVADAPAAPSAPLGGRKIVL